MLDTTRSTLHTHLIEILRPDEKLSQILSNGCPITIGRHLKEKVYKNKKPHFLQHHKFSHFYFAKANIRR